MIHRTLTYLIALTFVLSSPAHCGPPNHNKRAMVRHVRC